MVWVLTLSPAKLIPRDLTPAQQVNGIRSLIRVGNLVGPLTYSVLYLRHSMTQGWTSIHFGENQLSPGLIGLSPLTTAHPADFQLCLVRSSTYCYIRFNLAMARSPGFGSAETNSTPS